MKAVIPGEKTGRPIVISVIDDGYGKGTDHPFEIAAWYEGTKGEMFDINDGDTVIGYLNEEEAQREIIRIVGEFWIPTLTGKKTKEITSTTKGV